MTTRSDELAALSLSAVSKAIATRDLSPVEVTQAVLERIERVEPALNSLVTVLGDQALDAARSAEAEIASGDYRGPLHGVPYTLKDLVMTKGIRTTGSSRILSSWVPERDATIVERFNRGGAVLIGKNNMLEFAYGEIHPDFGPALNPWNTDFGTSGSSSGSGAAVAAGLGYASIGSDTGGSIRFPAALCGVIGLKPTYGLVSRSGALPLSWTLDHLGPMTRTARDAALVLDVIAGHDPADPASAPTQSGGYTAQVDAAPRPLRIGIPSPATDDGLNDEARSAFRSSVEAVRSLGHQIDEFTLPDPAQTARVELGILYPEATAIHLRWLRERPEDYAPNTRERLELGAAIPGTVYVRALRVASVIVEQYRRLFDRFDVLMTPLAANDGYLVATPPVQAVSEEGDRLAPLFTYSAPFNITGLPAVSVPCSTSARGLPFAAQFVGRPFADGQILQLAQQFQDAVHDRIHRPAGGYVV